VTSLKPLPLSERVRHSAATLGVILWLAFPFVYMAGTHARWLRRCQGRSFTGAFDSCFNDALPMFEFVAFPVTLALTYLIARFAFSMFAPVAELRTRKWRLADTTCGEAFPRYQVFSAFGLIWTALHASSTPFSFTYWYLLAYWAAWLLWFIIGALSALPLTPQD
jgi:hypothetical protein